MFLFSTARHFLAFCAITDTWEDELRSELIIPRSFSNLDGLIGSFFKWY